MPCQYCDGSVDLDFIVYFNRYAEVFEHFARRTHKHVRFHHILARITRFDVRNSDLQATILREVVWSIPMETTFRIEVRHRHSQSAPHAERRITERILSHLCHEKRHNRVASALCFECFRIHPISYDILRSQSDGFTTAENRIHLHDIKRTHHNINATDIFNITIRTHRQLILSPIVSCHARDSDGTTIQHTPAGCGPTENCVRRTALHA